MFELKELSREAIPRSLEKAERYRLLNEPAEAESICLDVLHIDPENQSALITLVLAVTDQFDRQLGAAVHRAEELLPRLNGEYERAYYTGIVNERRAKARLLRGGPGAESTAYDWFRQAMEWFEKAEDMAPHGNDDAALRWNTCARTLMHNPHLKPGPQERVEAPLE
jgi:hypothetical protein